MGTATQMTFHRKEAAETARIKDSRDERGR